MSNNIPKENLGLLYTRRYYEDVDPEGPNILSKKNDRLISISKISPDEVFDYPATEDSFELTTIYPGMISGIGILHAANAEGEVKFGLSFDHTTGLPIIPGSSVKGVLRSLFPIREKNKTIRSEKIKYIKDKLNNEIDIDKLEKDIFDNGKVVFFDAVIVKAKNAILGLDYITPHGNPSNPIELLQDPNPIQFMRIEPDVTFRFSFLLDSSDFIEYSLDKKDILNLFESILKDIGIGAKTNVGYGQLSNITSTTDNCASLLCNDAHDNNKTNSSKQEYSKNQKHTTQIQEIICSGELIQIKGRPLQVRILDHPQYSQPYDLEFLQESDRKKTDRKAKHISVKVVLLNNKVKKVYFQPDN